MKIKNKYNRLNRIKIIYKPALIILSLYQNSLIEKNEIIQYKKDKMIKFYHHNIILKTNSFKKL